MKRINSTLYLSRRRKNSRADNDEENEGYLYAHGIYRTKILPSDLPEFFVHGILGDREAYISAFGVKHLVYQAPYFSQNVKDDVLYISYDKPIEPDPESINSRWYHGYKHSVSGSMIIPFLFAAEKYSGYPIADILRQVDAQEENYRNHCK